MVGWGWKLVDWLVGTQGGRGCGCRRLHWEAVLVPGVAVCIADKSVAAAGWALIVSCPRQGMSACVRAGARACVRACVRACMCLAITEAAGVIVAVALVVLAVGGWL